MGKEKKTRETVREFIHHINNTEEDIDITVDGIDCIAICGGEIGLTEEGMKKFGPVLDMEMHGFCIVGSSEDYELLDSEEGNLWLAWDFVSSLAGYCSASDYEKWFEGKDVTLI